MNDWIVERSTSLPGDRKMVETGNEVEDYSLVFLWCNSEPRSLKYSQDYDNRSLKFHFIERFCLTQLVWMPLFLNNFFSTNLQIQSPGRKSPFRPPYVELLLRDPVMILWTLETRKLEPKWVSQSSLGLSPVSYLPYFFPRSRHIPRSLSESWLGPVLSLFLKRWIGR